MTRTYRKLLLWPVLTLYIAVSFERQCISQGFYIPYTVSLCPAKSIVFKPRHICKEPPVIDFVGAIAAVRAPPSNEMQTRRGAKHDTI